MKIRIFFVALVIQLTAHAQSFVLSDPPDWRSESMTFPIGFAPNIPYAGEEYLLFAPGWGDTTSTNHWSYCFLWWINGSARLNVTDLTKNFEEYYGGLVGRNIISRKIDPRFIVPTKATLRQPNTDLFTGYVDMLNYMSLHPIRLHIEVHVQSCAAQNKLAAFVMISPQQRPHEIWKKFDEIWSGFKCSK